MKEREIERKRERGEGEREKEKCDRGEREREKEREIEGGYQRNRETAGQKKNVGRGGRKRDTHTKRKIQGKRRRGM